MKSKGRRERRYIASEKQITQMHKIYQLSQNRDDLDVIHQRTIQPDFLFFFPLYSFDSVGLRK